MAKKRKKKVKKKSGIYLALKLGKQKPLRINKEKALSKEYEKARRLLQAMWYYDGPGQTAKDLKKTGKAKNRADIARDLIKAGKLKPLFQAGALPKRLKPGYKKVKKVKKTKTTPEERAAVLKAAYKIIKKQKKARKKKEKESALMPLALELDAQVRGVLNLVRKVLSDSDSLKAIISPTRISKKRKKALKEVKNLLHKGK